MAITAINKKYQRLVNKAYKFNRKYHSFVDLDGTFDTDREQAANDRKQANAYEQEQEALAELPKREINNFNKQYKALHGYGA